MQFEHLEHTDKNGAILAEVPEAHRDNLILPDDV